MDIWILYPNRALSVCVYILHTFLQRTQAVDPVLFHDELLHCPTYQYATYNIHGDLRCRDCSACGRGMEIAIPCTSRKDTKCRQCVPGTYNAQRGGNCRPCMQCQPGTYVDRQCDYKRDTVCKPCPSGHFSDSKNCLACTPCTVCRKYEVLKRRCRRDSDTECGQCEVGFFREFGTRQCLPCFKCEKYNNQVVDECLHTVGMVKQKTICWPHTTSEAQAVSTTSASKTTSDIEISTRNSESEYMSFETDVSIKTALAMVTLLVLLLLIAVIVYLLDSTWPGRFFGTPTQYLVRSRSFEILQSSADSSLIQSMTDSSRIDDSQISHYEIERSIPLNTNFRDADIINSSFMPGGKYVPPQNEDLTEETCIASTNRKERVLKFWLTAVQRDRTHSNRTCKYSGDQSKEAEDATFYSDDHGESKALFGSNTWPRHKSSVNASFSDIELVAGSKQSVNEIHEDGVCFERRDKHVDLPGDGCITTNTNNKGSLSSPQLDFTAV